MKSEAWRKLGKAFRRQLVRQDDCALTPIVPGCPIERYYTVAARVQRQFEDHPIEQREDLLEAYLMGHRLDQFLQHVLPTHPKYVVPFEGHAQVQEYLQALALVIDELEYKAHVSKVIDDTISMGSQTSSCQATGPSPRKVSPRSHKEIRQPQDPPPTQLPPIRSLNDSITEPILEVDSLPPVDSPSEEWATTWPLQQQQRVASPDSWRPPRPTRVSPLKPHNWPELRPPRKVTPESQRRRRRRDSKNKLNQSDLALDWDQSWQNMLLREEWPSGWEEEYNEENVPVQSLVEEPYEPEPTTHPAQPSTESQPATNEPPPSDWGDYHEELSYTGIDFFLEPAAYSASVNLSMDVSEPAYRLPPEPVRQYDDDDTLESRIEQRFRQLLIVEEQNGVVRRGELVDAPVYFEEQRKGRRLQPFKNCVRCLLEY